MTGKLFFICLFVFYSYVESARILGVFPMAGSSHYILYSKLMKGLVAAGHDVTMVSPIPMKDVPKNGKYTGIVLEELVEEFKIMLRTTVLLFEMQNQNHIAMMQQMTSSFLKFSNMTLHHPKVQTLLQSKQKFDAVVLEQFTNDALKVFSYIYECPLIILSSMGPNSWVSPTVGNPQPVSYVPHLLSDDFSNDLSFKNRFKNLMFYISDYFLSNYYVFPKHEEIMHQAFPNAPPLYDLFTNVSLLLLNSHTSLYPALPTVPNMVEIGGYFIDPPKPLPKDLKQFLDGAKEGAIYFSMGSNLKSKDMPQERKQMILNVLGRLKEKVLWKFEEDLPEKPANIMIQKWLPQQDILAHPNIKLFITHGGLLSTTETIYHGVPILAIPVFGDQMANAARAVSNGYGLKLGYNSPEFTEENLEKKINELLTDPQYKENARKRSKIFHDRPMGPMETAVYWVEYVIRHRGAPHLRVAGVRQPLYEYFLVDVFAAILAAVAVVLTVFLFIVKKVYSVCCDSSKKVKKVKTK